MFVWKIQFSTFAKDTAGKFSSATIAIAVAALSATVFAASEHENFTAWAKSYYGQDYKFAASQKAAKLPPIDDALSYASLRPTFDDDFSRSLTTSKFWRKQGGSNASKYIKSVNKSNLIGSNQGLFFDPIDPYRAERRIPQSGLIRTMCVRSCDGYMWPISFSTSTRNLSVDENICRNSCAAPTRLYYYSNPGQEVSEMVDRRGNSYNRLPTAWLYQQQRVASCKCRPEPWEQQAKARHAMYATLKQQGKLKRHLRTVSRQVRRLSRRASIGSYRYNSSLVAAAQGTTASTQVKITKKTSVPKYASGFSSKSYKSNGSYINSNRAFRRAFREDR